MARPAIQRCLELLSHVSLRNQYRLAECIALVIRLIPNQVSKQTRDNIKLCFSDLTQAEQKQLYRDSIRHTCYSMTELASVWCWPADKILARVTSLDICPEFDQSTKSKIILAPHLGSWEMLVIWLGRACDAMILYKRRKNRTLDRFILDSRARTGGTPVPTKKRGLRKLLVGLKKGENLMILPDQKPAANKGRIKSHFFDASAPTTKLVQTLCAKVDCDVFMATISRSDPPGEFGLRIERLEHSRLAADETDSAQYMNDQIEQRCRLHLEQYQWGYRRFTSSAYETVK